MDDTSHALLGLITDLHRERQKNERLEGAIAQRDETIAGLERHLSIIERDAALHGMQAEPHA